MFREITMKAIHLPSAIIGSITAKSKNNGISFRVSTPELNKDELGVVFDLQDQVVDLLIQPSDIEFADIVEVKSEVEKKSQSSRIRGSLFVLWQKRGEEGSFNDFYIRQTDKFIDRIKELIDEAK